MKVLRVLCCELVLLAGQAVAQPVAPGPGETPPENRFGPMVLPLIVGTAGLIALIVYVVWRMVSRMRRR